MARFPVNYIHNVGKYSVYISVMTGHLYTAVVHSLESSDCSPLFPLTTEMDKRRLSYLAYTAHQEHKLHQQHTSHLPLLPDLEILIEGRALETEQCNMLLILLMAGLEYDLPLNLMRATLETAKLNHIG